MSKKGSGSEKEGWSESAKTYCTCLMIIPAYFAKVAAEYLIEAEDISSPISFLDIACGPGTLALEFIRLLQQKRSVSNSSFLVTDYAAGMVESATQNIAETHLDSTVNVTAQIMDAQCLSLESSSITDIGCMFGVMFFPDRFVAYSEMLRVLQGGGRAVIGTWGRSQIGEIWMQFMDFIQVDCQETLKALNSIQICSDPVVFREELEANGFCDVQVYQHSHTFEMPNTLETFTSFASNSILRKSIKHVDKASLWASWSQFLLGHASDWLSDTDHFHITMTANIAVAFAPLK